MGLSLKNVDKIVGREMHLKDITLDFESSSLCMLLGRTLAGKTSLLRIMAGIDRPTAGRVLIEGRDVTALPPGKHNIAQVFQFLSCTIP